MRVLITGANGFIARELIEELAPRHELALLARRPPGVSHRIPAKLSGLFARTATFPFFRTDVLDEERTTQAAKGMDAIIHLAGCCDLDNPVKTFRTIALGTFTMLEAARKAGVKTFLNASSICAYGTFYWRQSGTRAPYDVLPLAEDFPSDAEDCYSLGKLAGEEVCESYSRAYGITTASFRIGSTWPEKMYSERLAQGLHSTDAWEEDLFNWVHVKDIVRGLAQALECSELPKRGIYNMVAADTRCPEPTIEILNKYRPDLAAKVRRPLNGRETLISIQRAKETFGYSPEFRLGT